MSRPITPSRFKHLMNMIGTVNPEATPSGRPIREFRVQPSSRQETSNYGAAAHPPEPGASLYSTDSEEQAASLYAGLDRCAALFSGLLQGPGGAVKGVANQRTSMSQGRKSYKKIHSKTGQSSCQVVNGRPGIQTQRTTHVAKAAHSGVTLHPSPEKTHLPLSLKYPQCLPASVLLSVSQSNSLVSPTFLVQPSSLTEQPSYPHTNTDVSVALPSPFLCLSPRHENESDPVPVEDHNTAVDTHPSSERVVWGQTEASQDTHGLGQDAKLRTVQHLQGELKDLTAEKGRVTKRLLSHQTQTVSSALSDTSVNAAEENAGDFESLKTQNTHFHRRVKVLNLQLKEREKAERQHNMEALCNSEVLTLQDELASAQSHLQDLQVDLLELRDALECNQNQLRDREAENIILKKELEAMRGRAWRSELERSELVSLAQHRMDEIERLRRLVERQHSSSSHTVVGSIVTEAPLRDQHNRSGQDPPDNRIAQYLLSLDKLQPCHMAVGRDTQEQETSCTGRGQQSHQHQILTLRFTSQIDQPQQQGKDNQRVFNSTLSQSDTESVFSGSTFDTRDEAVFQEGLAALDASIASLQKTIKLDLGS